MKAILSILFLTLFCCHYTQAQVNSSKKNAQVEAPVETAKPVVTESNSATVVSGSRKAVSQEVSLENKGTTENTNSVKTETTSLLRKPD